MKLAVAIQWVLFATLYINQCRPNNIQDFADTFIDCTVDFIQVNGRYSFNEAYISPSVNNYSPLIFDSLDKSKRLNRKRILNTSIPLETAMSSLHNRFVSCTLFLVNIDFLFTIRENTVLLKQNEIQDLLKTLVLAKEDPHFICFVQVETPPFQEMSLITAYGTISLAEFFKFVSFTSVFMIIASDMEVFIMCMPCTYTDESAPVFPLDIGNASQSWDYPAQLRYDWNYIHADLNGAPVNVPGFREPLWQQVCNRPFSLHTHEATCAALAIGSLYNFTTALNHQSNGYQMAEFHQGSVGGAKFIENYFFQRHQTQRYMWVPFACSYNPYIFVTFYSNEHMSLEVLLKPLEVWLWSAYCSFLIFTVLCLAMLNRSNSKGNSSLLKRISDAFMWTVSVNLEQSQEPYGVNNISSSGYGVKTLVSLCSNGCVLTAFLVGLAYKTGLFSCLTTKFPPPVSKNIQELFSSGRTYGTTTRHFYSNKPYSTLKDIVLADLFDVNAGDWSHNEFISRFERNLVFLDGSDLELVLNISKGLPIHFGGELATVPESFVLISTAYDVRSFLRLMSRYSYHKHVLNNEPTPFMTRVSWYGIQNFFSENFITALAWLQESGIYDRWKINHKIHLQIERLTNAEISSKL
jgi:hypothetical protein